MKSVHRGLDPEPLPFGVGSLPHTDSEEAVDFVESWCAAVPFWPQLPRRSANEGFAASCLESGLGEPVFFKGTHRDSLPVRRNDLPSFVEQIASLPAGFSRESASGFFAFEEAMSSGRFPDAQAIKGQLPGPLTLAGMIEDEGGLSYRDDPDLLAGLKDRLLRLARWQVERLGQFDRPVILCVDEPGLFAWLDTDSSTRTKTFAVLKDLLDEIRRLGATAGLHCCAQFPMEILSGVRPDLLSFDAHAALEKLLGNKAGRDYLVAGGRIAFGLVPTGEDLDQRTPGSLADRLEAATHGLGKLGQNVEFISASCGLGTLSRDAASRSFRYVIAVCQEIHSRR